MFGAIARVGKLRGFLGIASWARMLRFVVPVALVVATAGFVTGQRWEQGLVARATLEARQEDQDKNRAAAAGLEGDLKQARDADTESAEALRVYLTDRNLDCGLDDDGLRLWRSWSYPPADRSQFIATLPGAAAGSDERGAAVPAGEPPPGG